MSDANDLLGAGDVAIELGFTAAAGYEPKRAAANVRQLLYASRNGGPHFPEPDARIGGRNLWRRSAITDFVPTRPGQGQGGGRPRRTAEPFKENP